GGTGLGLAITKHIIDRHDGTIRFDSVLGEGTTVHIELPLLPDEEDEFE
ncbi:MAG TPA: two-component sensor histidine kinase, partial [Exiguobacterium sp.]|nr:two-component sensor histidine kinase [Exiguobacterium sp.]